MCAFWTEKHWKQAGMWKNHVSVIRYGVKLINATIAFPGRHLRQKCQKTKIEIVDSKVYQVIARYLEIDEVPYVMEMINSLERDDIIDAEDKENLLAELSGYADALYKDVLTGVFNRRY